MEPLISIIVPIYKVEQYLSRCINSIINQTYKKLEVILVDDGSPDNCPKICDEYSKVDKRIKVLHKKNGGLSDARNAGLRIATGEYVLFVDSDDYIELNACESLVEIIEENDVDLITFKLREVVDERGEKSIDTNTAIILDKQQIYRKYLYGEDIFHSACTKLYKKRLFNNIKFPQGKKAEDLATTYLIILEAKSFIYYDKTLYNYDRRNDSIMGSNSTQLIIDAYEFTCRKFEMEIQIFPEYFIQEQSLYVNCILRTISRLLVDKDSSKEKIIEDCKKRINNIQVNKLSMKSKLAYYAYKISPKIFSWIIFKSRII